MARNGLSKSHPPSIRNADDYISLEDGVKAGSSHDQRRGVKRKASVLDERDTTTLKLHERSRPWMQSVRDAQYETAIDILNAEVDAFNTYIRPRDEEHSVRLMVIECIRSSITRKWPSARVLAFGSQETQLYFPNGDIDLVVHYDGISVERKDQIVSFLSEISCLLQQAKVSRRVNLIGKARVPIIKFVTELGHFAVDISVNQTNGLRAVTVVNRFLWYLPAVRPLVMVIKAFLLQRGLNEPYSGGFGSYTVICMVVSFLQMHPKIRRKEIDPRMNLGVLLLDFLELYGRYFNYSEVGISIRNGGSYFSREKRGWLGADFRGPPRMTISVEDPVDIRNDISRSSAAARVRDALAAAFESLSTSVIVRGQELEARQKDSYVVLGSVDNESISLLGSIVSLAQDMLNFRRDVQLLFSKGSLQNFLGLPPTGLWPPVKLHDGNTMGSESSIVGSKVMQDGARQSKDLDTEEDELIITGDTPPSPESRYKLVCRQQKEQGRIVYEEDQSVSEKSLSPVTEVIRGLRSEDSPRKKDSRRAFWAAKGAGNTEDLEQMAEKWEYNS